MSPTIGFIGLGRMGKPMAENLLRAGYPLVVHNRSRGPVDELVELGARAGDSPREVAASSDLVITMLTDPATVERVVAGLGGVLEGAPRGGLVLDMTTSSPRLARALAAQGRTQGVDILDAPVSGGQIGARDASLSIMVGGEAAAFERVLPVLECLGKNIVHVGDAGAGQVVKAVNQLIVAQTIEAVAEGLVLAAKAGADPARARAVMKGGFASSRVLELHGQRMIDGDFVPGGRSALHQKDLEIGLELAREYGVRLPGAELANELYKALIAAGHGDDDHSALYRLLEDE
jgi:2-hydroxy-3-oxopropionate reductase